MKTASHRPERMADLIRQEVAQFLLSDINDDRLGFVTITRVNVTADLQIARVYYTAFGTKQERADSGLALRDAAPRVRTHLAKNIRARYVPRVEFFIDEGLEESYRIQNLLSEISQKKKDE